MKKLIIRLHQLDPISVIPVCPQNNLRKAPVSGIQCHQRPSMPFIEITARQILLTQNSSDATPLLKDEKRSHHLKKIEVLGWPVGDSSALPQLCDLLPLHSIPWPHYLLAFLKQVEVAPTHGFCLQISSIRNPSTRLLSSLPSGLTQLRCPHWRILGPSL